MTGITGSCMAGSTGEASRDTRLEMRSTRNSSSSRLVERRRTTQTGRGHFFGAGSGEAKGHTEEASSTTTEIDNKIRLSRRILKQTMMIHGLNKMQ